MAKLKVDDEDLNIKELEDAEYDPDKRGGGDYEEYDGEIPPKGTVLRVLVKKMWWTYSQADNPMLKVLLVADGNEGDEKEFEGLPIWENMALIASVKFRWYPFLALWGLTIRDVKTKTQVDDDPDDPNGALITEINGWEPGSEDAYCRIVTKREKYNGEWSAKADEWLSDDEADGEPDDPEPEPEEKPARRGRRAAAEPEKPAGRSRRAPARDTAKATTATRAGSRRSRSTGSDEEPPF